jgi:hypothetical protein
MDQVLTGAKSKQIYYVAGEHILRSTTADCIWSDVVRRSGRRETAGTVSITRTLTSSG